MPQSIQEAQRIIATVIKRENAVARLYGYTTRQYRHFGRRFNRLRWYHCTQCGKRCPSMGDRICYDCLPF